jgi:hypothetical protein
MVLEVGVQMRSAQRPRWGTQIAEVDIHQPVSEDVVGLSQAIPRSGGVRGVQDERQVELIGKGAQLL